MRMHSSPKSGKPIHLCDAQNAPRFLLLRPMMISYLRSSEPSLSDPAWECIRPLSHPEDPERFEALQVYIERFGVTVHRQFQVGPDGDVDRALALAQSWRDRVLTVMPPLQDETPRDQVFGRSPAASIWRTRLGAEVLLGRLMREGLLPEQADDAPASEAPAAEDYPPRRRRGEEVLAAMHEAIEQTGGACLESVWLGSRHAYRFRCRMGHEWARRPERLQYNLRCPKCPRPGNLKHDNLQKLQALAQERGGRCLSERYLGNEAHYRFECTAGHQWEASFKNIVRGTWCRQCYVEARRRSPSR
jgi:hypothetical protein